MSKNPVSLKIPPCLSRDWFSSALRIHEKFSDYRNGYKLHIGDEIAVMHAALAEAAKKGGGEVFLLNTLEAERIVDRAAGETDYATTAIMAFRNVRNLYIFNRQGFSAPAPSYGEAFEQDYFPLFWP